MILSQPPRLTAHCTLLAAFFCNLLSVGFGASTLLDLDPDKFNEQRFRNSIALHAKLLCSGVFVSKRDPQAVIDEDLHWKEYTFHDWGSTEWNVDRDSLRVSVSAPLPNTADSINVVAQYHTAHGCTLLPVGAERVSFVPRIVDQTDALMVAVEHGQTGAEPPETDSTLGDAMIYAFANEQHEIPQNTRAIVVIHRGQVVAERYAEGFGPSMPMLGWSMGKSISAALLGILAKQTDINVDDPVPVSSWKKSTDPRSSISYRQLLQMTSGLGFRNPSYGDSLYYTDPHQHESVYFSAENTEQLVLNARLQYQPGTVFQYRNTNTLTLMSLIKKANINSGTDHLTWPLQVLFQRIGATSFVLEPDAYGNFIVTGNVYATARDWGKLGLFFLNAGRINDEALWPKGWLEVLTTPSARNRSYGGQIWLNQQGMMPDTPRDTYFFRGWLGQLVVVVPSNDLVVVRLGYSDSDGYIEYANELIRRLLLAL